MLARMGLDWQAVFKLASNYSQMGCLAVTLSNHSLHCNMKTPHQFITLLTSVQLNAYIPPGFTVIKWLIAGVHSHSLLRLFLLIRLSIFKFSLFSWMLSVLGRRQHYLFHENTQSVLYLIHTHALQVCQHTLLKLFNTCQPSHVTILWGNGNDFMLTIMLLCFTTKCKLLWESKWTNYKQKMQIHEMYKPITVITVDYQY